MILCAGVVKFMAVFYALVLLLFFYFFFIFYFLFFFCKYVRTNVGVNVLQCFCCFRNRIDAEYVGLTEIINVNDIGNRGLFFFVTLTRRVKLIDEEYYLGMSSLNYF